MMKVVILADFPLHCLPENHGFSPPRGHWATWLPQIAEIWSQPKLFEAHWITLSTEVDKEKIIQEWNQTFHVLPSWSRARASTGFLADRWKIRNKLQQIKPDLVHAWGNENIWGWAMIESGLPNIFSVQGLLGVYAKLGNRTMRSRLMALIEAVVLRKAQVITTESPWARKQIEQQTGRHDVRLVEYGVPREFFEAKSCPDANNPFALMVGTADHRKGIDFAVQLFSRPELRQYKLKIVGGVTSFGEVWKRNSPSNVEWVGRRTQAEIIQLMSKASCLVLPTRGDTCPNVVKEARVIGLPIVASPHGGHVQYVKSEINGFVSSLDTPEVWSRAIRHLIDDPAQAKSMGLADRLVHRELLKPERTATSFMALYRERISECSARKGQR
jgi:glycosyltransferase involved in cell wall biosynthesis